MLHDETPQEPGEAQPHAEQSPTGPAGGSGPAGAPRSPHPQPAEQPPRQGLEAVQGSAVPALDGSVVVDGVLYRPAGFLPRLGAFLIDFVILSMFYSLLLRLIDFQPMDEQEMMNLLSDIMSALLSMQPLQGELLARMEEMLRISRIAGWLNVAVCFSYYTIFHTVAGATLGKLCLGLTVLTRRGHRIGFGTACLRYLCRLALSRLFFGGAIVIFFDTQRRTAYDMVAGTNVFRAVPRQDVAAED